MRALGAVLRWIGRVYGRLVTAAPGGAVGLFLIVCLAIVAVTFLIRRRSASGRAKRSTSGDFDLPADRTSDQLRVEAEDLAARGDWAGAVRARLRAVVKRLEERGVIDPRPGRTAAEVADEAGRERPDLRAELWSGALVFGEIWYGGRAASAADYRTLSELDAHVGHRSAPAHELSAAGSAAPAPPR